MELYICYLLLSSTSTRPFNNLYRYIQVRVIHIDTTDQSFDTSGAIKLFEVKDEEMPTARLMPTNKGIPEKKIAPTFNGLDTANLKPWIQNYLEGKSEVCMCVCMCVCVVLLQLDQ